MLSPVLPAGYPLYPMIVVVCSEIIVPNAGCCCAQPLVHPLVTACGRSCCGDQDIVRRDIHHFVRRGRHMLSRLTHRKRLAAFAAAFFLPGALLPLAGASSALPADRHDVTDPAEAERVDRVPVRDVEWGPCAPQIAVAAGPAHYTMPLPSGHGMSVATTLECGTHVVPLDYDMPKGPQMTLQLTKRPAANPDERIGTLFTNPGGPGESGALMPMVADMVFTPEVLNKFDIVGIDPRAVGGTPGTECFDSLDEAIAATSKPQTPPRTATEKKEFAEDVRAVARGCSRWSNTIARHASSAQTARDMDVMRRAVGDEKLTYFGISYGTVLGQTYAELFPDRVRALAIDGVIDLARWHGYDGTRSTNMTIRVGSPEAGDEALQEVLRLCDEAGASACPPAGNVGSLLDAFKALKETLRENPVEMPGIDGKMRPMDDRGLVELMAQLLRTPEGSESIPGMIVQIGELTDGKTQEPSAELVAAVTAAAGGSLAYNTVSAAGANVAESDSDSGNSPGDGSGDGDSNGGRDEDSGDEGSENDDWLAKALAKFHPSRLTVMCTDGDHPTPWSAAKQAANQPAPLTGDSWVYFDTECSHPAWTAQDYDRLSQVKSPKTAAPVLIIGNYWDPATPYAQAKIAASRIPNNFFLSSNNWGHGATVPVPCVKDAVEKYLVDVAEPATDMCHVRQPFEPQPEVPQ